MYALYETENIYDASTQVKHLWKDKPDLDALSKAITGVTLSELSDNLILKVVNISKENCSQRIHESDYALDPIQLGKQY